MEEVRETTKTETRFVDNRDRAVKLGGMLWRDFGPLIVGAFVLIAVLVGGWMLFRKSTSTPTTDEIVLDEQSSDQVVLPESSINISGSQTPLGGTSASPSSPSPSPMPTTTPSPKPAVATGEPLSQTKGNLPQTGPEEIFAVISLASLGGGLYLRRLSQKFSK